MSDILKPDTATFWQIKLIGGLHNGKVVPSHGPYPTMRTPEGEYRRVRYDAEARTAEYEWDEESKPAKGLSSQGDGLGAPVVV